MDVQEKQFAQLLEAIQTDVGAGRLRGIVYVHFRGHDETPSVCREIVAESGETHASKSRTAKVRRVEHGVGDYTWAYTGVFATPRSAA